MAGKKKFYGFGYTPFESQHHFLVEIPKSNDDVVTIYERFQWQDEEEVQQLQDFRDHPKVELSKHKWKQIEAALKTEFNKRLKQEKKNVGQWKFGQVVVERLLGKEMVLLVWAIEDCDPSVIPDAIKNWLGLSPEERWWLFTMTNATTGSVHDKRGWRKAIRYALTENPVQEGTRQGNLFEFLMQKELEQ